MQKIAAYLLERRDGMSSVEDRATEASALKSKITEWLRSKGATKIVSAGTYAAEDESHATFAIEDAVDASRTWWMARLEEVTANGRRFVAAISVTNATDMVAVYATMEAGSDATLINPVEVDPRCPKVIRELLDLPGRWWHGTSDLRLLRRVEGFEAGEVLATEIASNERTVPFLVVTEEEGHVVLPQLDERLAYDLAGLANVVVLDMDATWALTDRLGRSLSCYRGAVRLFWPRISTTEDPYRHPLWTAQRLRSTAVDLVETRERFRKQLRGVVMRAAALSVVRPSEIDSIRRASSQRAFAEMRERASSLHDYKEIADSYAKENDQVRAKNIDLLGQVEQLQAQIAELEAERGALLVRVENAEVSLRYRPAVPENIAPDPIGGGNENVVAPMAGEVRFYKKVHSAPTHDVMVRVSDCGCNKWQGAHPADKARKGVAKLEQGRNDWAKMQHCASCTGGGMWKVRW